MVSFLFRNSRHMKKFSKIFSCCEYNHSNDKFTKLDVHFFLDMSFQKNLFGKLRQFFFIDFSKKKNLCMTYIDSINNMKINKIKNISTEKKSKYKKLFQFKSNRNLSDQKNKLYFSEIIFFFVYKSKHHGCIEKKLNIFVNNNPIVRLVNLKERFVFFLKNLQKKNVLRVAKWGCFFIQREKMYFSKIRIRILKKNKKCSSFNYYKYFFESPPCINCSLINNCHPQGIISPFECYYISSWNYKKGPFCSIGI
nr:DNA-directed RNA polymerases III, 39 kDa polypeptide [Cryptomonas paramecium]